MNLRLLVPIALAAVLDDVSAQAPSGWKQQLLTASATASAFAFDEMIPGFHVTAKTAGGLVYPASERGEGRFAVNADIVLFPDAADRGYGIFVGGAEAAGRVTSWTAFLIAGDGRYGVARYGQGAPEWVLPFSANDAVIRRAGKTVTNRLRVEVEPDSVRFLANGTRLAALPRSAVPVDGLLGLHFNEGLNVHVTDVDATRRLLERPPPRGR